MNLASPTTTRSSPPRQPARPLRPPPPATATLRSALPPRGASLTRGTAQRDPHLDAALENRRKHGVPTGALAVEPSREPQHGREHPAAHGVDVRDRVDDEGEDEDQFVNSYSVTVETWDDALPSPSEPPKRNDRESLMPLGGATPATVSRMTSTRRYMDQLDDDEAEEESLRGGDPAAGEARSTRFGPDRASWNSGWTSEARDSVASLGAHVAAGRSKQVPRESTLSAMTFESQASDAFHYSMYEHMSSPMRSRFPVSTSLSSLPSRAPSQPLEPFAASRPTAQSDGSYPIVRIDTNMSDSDSFLDHPRDSTHWDPASVPTRQVAPLNVPNRPIPAHSPLTTNSSVINVPSSDVQHRVPVQTAGKNFSRPFLPRPPAALPAQPLPSSLATGLASTTTVRTPPRSDSLDSPTSPLSPTNPLDRKPSLGVTSSSMDHSGSSAGHSMSTSWEDRQMQGLAREFETRKMVGAGQGRHDEDEGKTTGLGEYDAYGGEVANEEAKEEIRFTTSRAEATSHTQDSPGLPYDASPAEPYTARFPSPRPARPLSPAAEPSGSPAPPGSLGPRSYGPTASSAFEFGPRPAPAPPATSDPPFSLPLPLPSSSPPTSRHRRPSNPSSPGSHRSPISPPIPLTPEDGPRSYFEEEPDRHGFPNPFATSTSSKPRNVLRKPRPRRTSDAAPGQEDRGRAAPSPAPSGVSAAMSRAGSSRSEQSGTSDGAGGRIGGAWARFRSRSKSRSRNARPELDAAIDAFILDDPNALRPPVPEPRLAIDDAVGPSRRPYDPWPSASLAVPLHAGLHPLPSARESPVPMTPSDFARFESSRPAFLRSKTSTRTLPPGATVPSMRDGTVTADPGKAWVLKSVEGVRTVQNGIVHHPESSRTGGAGEEHGSVYGDDRVEALHVDHASASGSGRRLVPGLGGGFAMNRSVSDQGPSTRPWDASTGHHDRRQLPTGPNSSVASPNSPRGPVGAYDDYSIYSLPPSPLGASITDGAGATATLRAKPSGIHDDGGQSTRRSTLQKAKEDLVRRGVLGGTGAPTMTRTPSGNERRADPVTSEDFLQVGIDHHEAGDLPRAAWCFEQSARKDGGSGAGMLMYGLTLRHGWGCQVNAPLGFRYLQMAAESVVEDLDRVVFGGRTLSESEANTKAAKSELVLALHEIGVSYRFGWGVEKNKKMAVSYFVLAADLGDADAQNDAAYCFANGKGCKKDLKKAAKYYRMAVASGGADWGLSWIYKPKYMDP
ncbi:hypothetical protein JCM10212_005265 [Sporobolomyces blumeae]